MRIGELSRRTGVPVATIKYYLREGLLPPGELTSPNQARYEERHVQRLRLIRALIEIGRLPVATIRQLVADLDQPEPDPHRILGRALHTVAVAHESMSDRDLAEATAATNELISRRGWQVHPNSPSRRRLAEVIAALRQVGLGDMLAIIDVYADAAQHSAAADLGLVQRQDGTDAMVYTAVVGTVLGDRLMAALRHLAHEDVSARTLRRGPADCS